MGNVSPPYVLPRRLLTEPRGERVIHIEETEQPRCSLKEFR